MICLIEEKKVIEFFLDREKNMIYIKKIKLLVQE